MPGRMVHILAHSCMGPKSLERGFHGSALAALLLLAAWCSRSEADSETWLFNGSLQGWTCTNCTATAMSQHVRIDPGPSDPQFISPVISFVPATSCANGN